MHIVIDARIINSSTGRYVERLLHYLQEVDDQNDYTVLVPSKDEQFFIPTSDNFTIKTADFDNYSFAEQFGFKKLLDQLQPDLVHFCMPQQPILYTGTKVTTFHDLSLLNTYNSDKNWLIFHAKQLVGKFVFKRVAKTSNQIVTPSEFTKNDLIEFSGVSPDKVTVTYESADVEVGSLEPYEHPFKHFILYVGQQSDYKNIRRLGDAHQRLIKKYPDLGLILVGKKTASHLSNEQYFSERNYKNILFTDFIPDSQRDWLYTKADAYVFPSLMEGFGLPGLEAMGYGAPIVSSNATCLPEIYGDAAHYFNPSDTTDMARAIDEVLANNILRDEMIKEGYKQLKKYSWLKMAEQTHRVYMKALKSKV
ncbi:glycosyltransferase family 4 protein [Candidatus Saccharibacteria bacterium]|nr:glycosyltransferase family 4 protein [Candidatus Saccharibacteria bacterium]